LKKKNYIILCFTLVILFVLIYISLNSCLGNIMKDNRDIFTIWIGVFGLFWGGKILGNLSVEYEKKYVSAIFGFYEHLETLTQRLILQISILDEETDTTENELLQPGPLFYMMWGDNETRSEHSQNCNLQQCELLKQLSFDFLKYLSTANDQVPPCDDKNSYNEWHKNKVELIKFLHNLQYISPDRYGSDDSTEVEEKFKKTLKLLEYFKDISSNRINSIFEIVSSPIDQ